MPPVRAISNLERLRRAHEWSQTDLGRIAGVSRSYIGMVEGGWVPPRHRRAAIAHALGLPPESIWPDPTPENDDGAGVTDAAKGHSNVGADDN
jgi:transcriptional regulator with XRE-family HTH domain